MCRKDGFQRQRSTTPEKAKDEESVLDETPSRKYPTGGIFEIPARVLKRGKAVLSV